MKFYVKSYKEIKKTSKEYLRALAPEMKKLCGKGPFEFADSFSPNHWFYEKKMGYFWHESWLNPTIENKQYLYKFE